MIDLTGTNALEGKLAWAGPDAMEGGRDGSGSEAWYGAGGKVGSFASKDGRITVLFDLNGVLVHSKRTSTRRAISVRPGIECLARLGPRIRLGLYSSATRSTILNALDAIDASLLKTAKYSLSSWFELILCRSYCRPAPEVHIRLGGNAWDTIKPLAVHFGGLERVVLIDDDELKAAPGERANMIAVPTWCGTDRDDGVLGALVDALLAPGSGVAGSGDVRARTAAIAQALLEAQSVSGAATSRTPASAIPHLPSAKPWGIGATALRSACTTVFLSAIKAMEGVRGVSLLEVLDYTELRCTALRKHVFTRARMQRAFMQLRLAENDLEEELYSMQDACAAQSSKCISQTSRIYLTHTSCVPSEDECKELMMTAQSLSDQITALPNASEELNKQACEVTRKVLLAMVAALQARKGPSLQLVRQHVAQAHEIKQHHLAALLEEAMGQPKATKPFVKHLETVGVEFDVVGPSVHDTLSKMRFPGRVAPGEVAQAVKVLQNHMKRVISMPIGKKRVRTGQDQDQAGPPAAKGDLANCKRARMLEADAANAACGTESAVAAVASTQACQRSSPLHSVLALAEALHEEHTRRVGMGAAGNVQVADAPLRAAMPAMERGGAHGHNCGAPGPFLEEHSRGLHCTLSCAQSLQNGQLIGRIEAPLGLQRGNCENHSLAGQTKGTFGSPDCPQHNTNPAALLGSPGEPPAGGSDGAASTSANTWLCADGEIALPAAHPPCPQARYGVPQGLPGHCSSFVALQATRWAPSPSFDPPSAAGFGWPEHTDTELVSHQLGWPSPLRSPPVAGCAQPNGAGQCRDMPLWARRSVSAGLEDAGGPPSHPQAPPWAPPLGSASQPPCQFQAGRALGAWLTSFGQADRLSSLGGGAAGDLRAVHPAGSTASLVAAQHTGQSSSGVQRAAASAAEGTTSAAAQERQSDSARISAALMQLHADIADFAARAAPREEEVAVVQEAVGAVAAAAAALWPGARTVLFGSQATGLALPGSDLDIVVLDVAAPLQRAASGFTSCALPTFVPQSLGLRGEKAGLMARLEALAVELRRRNLLRGAPQLIRAKVPIIKARLALGRIAVAADISLGAANGATAVQYILRQVHVMPQMRALTLVIKALLKEAGLNEVFTGGLSSYSVVNMVIAHLQAEGHPLAPELLAGGTELPSAVPSAELVESMPAAQGQGLGELLCRFLDRFGSTFDYRHQAVSVRMGGIVPKQGAWYERRKPWLLAVEDPQEAGKDIGGGSFKILQVRRCFASAAEALALGLSSWEGWPGRGAAPGAGGAAWASVQAEGHTRSVVQPGPLCGLLGCILDVKLALGRHAAACKARMRKKHSAAHGQPHSAQPRGVASRNAGGGQAQLGGKRVEHSEAGAPLQTVPKRMKGRKRKAIKQAAAHARKQAKLLRKRQCVRGDSGRHD